MKHIRQILLDKTASHRIGVAQSQGNLDDLALAKARFEQLDYSEVTFGDVEESYPGSKRYQCNLTLTGRDGFTFRQFWCPGNSVPVLKGMESFTLETVNELKQVIRPGLYYVQGVAELWLVALESQTLEEIATFLGYQFDEGELELVLNHLKINSVIIEGTIPLQKVTSDINGQVTDGSSLTLYTSETPTINPFNQPTQVTVEYSGVEVLSSKDVKVVFKEGPLKDQTFQGTLDDTNRFKFDVTLEPGMETLTSSALVQVGLKHDNYSDFGTITIADEDWQIAIDGEDSLTTNIRANNPDAVTGNIWSAVDGQIKPWGTPELEPGIYIHPDDTSGQDPTEKLADVDEDGNWIYDFLIPGAQAGETYLYQARGGLGDNVTAQFSVTLHPDVSISELTFETNEPAIVEIDTDTVTEATLTGTVVNEMFPYEFPVDMQVELKGTVDTEFVHTASVDEFGEVSMVIPITQVSEDTDIPVTFGFEGNTVPLTLRMLTALEPVPTAINVYGIAPTYEGDPITVSGRIKDQYGEYIDTLVVGEFNGETYSNTEGDSSNYFQIVIPYSGLLSGSVKIRAGNVSKSVTLTWLEKLPPVTENMTVVPTQVAVGESYTVSGNFKVDYTLDWTGYTAIVTDDAGVDHEVPTDAAGNWTYTGSASVSGDHALSVVSKELPNDPTTVNLTVSGADGVEVEDTGQDSVLVE